MNGKTMSVWDNKEFARQWNMTYGLDMSGAPMRAGIIYPLMAARICWPRNRQEKIRIADFGCGNGNFIRAFLDRRFVQWLGIDSGDAILATARPLADNSKIRFLNRDIGQKIPEMRKSIGFDRAVSIFTLEEIPFENTSAFFNNMANAVHKRAGSAHIFTQHPAYALQQDIVATIAGAPNEKFQGHRGYFDTSPTTYNLAVLNGEKNVCLKPAHHHRPFAAIINGLSAAGLSLQEAREIPAGVIDMKGWQSHEPQRGDVPRFLYLCAKPSSPPSPL